MGSKETPIQKAILDYLKVQPDVFAWRNNSGVIMKPRFIRYGYPGSADILGCLNTKFNGPNKKTYQTGRFFALEVKAAKGKQSENQLEFAAKIRATGGFYAVVHDVDEAKCALERARSGWDK